MLKLLLLACTCIVALVAATPLPKAVVHADELTGGMSKLSYLLGEWACKSSRSNENDGGIITFEPSVDNTLHEHIKGEHYESDAFFVYSSTLKSYYMVYATNGGFYGFIMSSDGHNFFGTTHAGGARTMHEVLDFNNISPRRITIAQRDVEDAVTVNFDAICMAR